MEDKGYFIKVGLQTYLHGQFSILLLLVPSYSKGINADLISQKFLLSFRWERLEECIFLHLIVLTCLQLKIILMPKWYFLVSFININWHTRDVVKNC